MNQLMQAHGTLGVPTSPQLIYGTAGRAVLSGAGILPHRHASKPQTGVAGGTSDVLSARNACPVHHSDMWTSSVTRALTRPVLCTECLSHAAVLTAGADRRDISERTCHAGLTIPAVSSRRPDSANSAAACIRSRSSSDLLRPQQLQRQRHGKIMAAGAAPRQRDAPTAQSEAQLRQQQLTQGDKSSAESDGALQPQRQPEQQHPPPPRWLQPAADACSRLRRRLRLPPTSRRHDAAIAAIAGPALLSLAADPLLSLVDTAFVGRLGPAELVRAGERGGTRTRWR